MHLINSISNGAANARDTLNANVERSGGFIQVGGTLAGEFATTALSSGMGKLVGAYTGQAITNLAACNPALASAFGYGIPCASAIMNGVGAFRIAHDAAKYNDCSDLTANVLATGAAIVAGGVSLHPLVGSGSDALRHMYGAQLDNAVSSFVRETMAEGFRGTVGKIGHEDSLPATIAVSVEHGGASFALNAELAETVKVKRPRSGCGTDGSGLSKIRLDTTEVLRNNGVAAMTGGTVSGLEHVTDAAANLAFRKNAKIKPREGWSEAHKGGLRNSADKIATKAVSRTALDNMTSGAANTAAYLFGWSDKTAKSVGQALQFVNPVRGMILRHAETYKTQRNATGNPDLEQGMSQQGDNWTRGGNSASQISIQSSLEVMEMRTKGALAEKTGQNEGSGAGQASRQAEAAKTQGNATGNPDLEQGMPQPGDNRMIGGNGMTQTPIPSSHEAMEMRVPAALVDNEEQGDDSGAGQASRQVEAAKTQGNATGNPELEQGMPQPGDNRTIGGNGMTQTPIPSPELKKGAAAAVLPKAVIPASDPREYPVPTTWRVDPPAPIAVVRQML